MYFKGALSIQITCRCPKQRCWSLKAIILNTIITVK